MNKLITLGGKKFFFRFALILALLSFNGYLNFYPLFSQAQKYINKKITRIIFDGNHHVSNSEMESLIQMRLGMRLSYSLLNRDLKSLFSNSSFSYARIEAEDYKDGVSVKFIVIERAIINKISFVGMDELNEQEVKDQLTLKENEIFLETKVSEAIEILLFKYKEKGFYNASIRTRKVAEGKNKDVINLTFLIDEGEEAKISKIEITGNVSFEEDDIKGELELTEDGFFADGAFKEEKFEADKENILKFYRSRGFLEVELLEASWQLRWANEVDEFGRTPDRAIDNERNIVIKYKVKEGEQFFFNGYDVTWDEKGLNSVTKQPILVKRALFDYFEYTNSDVGKIFDDERFKRDRGIINYLYSQRGYITTRVIPEKTIITLTEEDLAEKEKMPQQIEAAKENKDYFNLKLLRKLLAVDKSPTPKKFVHTKFIIVEGETGFLESIIIKGNKKTLDKVIRRELLLKEGMLFNAELVQRSRERVYNLGFFKEVNVDARPGSTERKLNLIIDVEEQPTGTISLGGGYGTQSGFSIFTEISENNLNGTGQRISGKVEFGPQRTTLQASWTEPWLYDEPWSLTLSGFYQGFERQVSTSLLIANQQEIAKYDVHSFGGTVGIGHRLGVNWYHYHHFSPSLSKRSNPSSLVDDSIYLLVSQGWQVKNSLINGIYYDVRDNVFNTTTGIRAEFAVEFVGNFLAGHEHFNRYSPSLLYYWWPFDFTLGGLFRSNALRRWRLVFEHRFSGAYTQQSGSLYTDQNIADNLFIEQENRLELGGYESLRGWNLYDINFPTAWRDGGSHRLLFGTELRIPVEPSLLWLVAFIEAGALYDEKSQYYIDETTSEAYINALDEAKLTKNNFSLDYFRYSWGFGFRLQIPILPLRIFMAQRLVWDPSSNWFRTIPGSDNFEFVFGIADRRF